MLDFTAILNQVKITPSYVPPVSLRNLGIKLFEAGQPVDDCLTDEMRRGWLWAHQMSSYADAAAYMVAQGMEVSL